jgi:GT2 family glycosyltransferase
VTPGPEIAVVIPTWAREHRLAFALEALAAQTLERERFEVIVARARGARPPLAPAPASMRVTFLEAEGGPSTRRNLGWHRSEAPLIAFTDDDCRPTPGWLAALADAAARNPGAIVQGRTEPDPAERHLLTGLARTIEVTAASPWYETCNIAYPRAVLEAVGGFDERLDECWGEDTDLGVRARTAGAGHVFADGALAFHAVVARPLPVAVRQARRRRWLAPLIARHPQLRSHLPWGVAANETHLTLPLALAGLLVGRRRPALSAALALPYLAPAFARQLAAGPRSARGLARTVLHLPAAVAVNAAEIAATVAGGIRDRTPVI